MNGRRLRLLTCNTQNNEPTRAKAVRPAAARPGRAGDVHHLRRRLRHARRAGVDRPRQAHARGVHRHRPDGAEAVRSRARPAGLQLRQRGAGRGLGDGRVRLAPRLAARRARHRHGDRLLPERRAGLRGALAAARRPDRGGGVVPVGPGRRVAEHPERDQPAPAHERTGDRHVHGRRVRRAVAASSRGLQDARQQHADPQLVGRRRELLAPDEPARDQLLLRHVRLGVRRRPEPAPCGGSGRGDARRRTPRPARAATSPARR